MSMTFHVSALGLIWEAQRARKRADSDKSKGDEGKRKGKSKGKADEQVRSKDTKGADTKKPSGKKQAGKTTSNASASKQVTTSANVKGAKQRTTNASVQGEKKKETDLFYYDDSVSRSVNRKRLHSRIWHRTRQEALKAGKCSEDAAELAAERARWALSQFDK